MKSATAFLATVTTAFLPYYTVDSQAFTNEFYCGDAPCTIPLRLSCEDMIAQYEFQGSCCSLESVPETRGCRLTVANRGNCFWYPYCGVPDPLDELIQAGIEFTTDTMQECPYSDYDALYQNTSHPDYIPPEIRENATASCVPTMAPSLGDGATNTPIGSSSSASGLVGGVGLLGATLMGAVAVALV